MSEQRILGIPPQAEIRDEMQQLISNDLHGPLGGEEEELASENPINCYPLGRLAPKDQLTEPEEQDSLADADTDDTEVDQEPSAPNAPSLTPSALGFTAYVDAACTRLDVHATWGRYHKDRPEQPESSSSPGPSKKMVQRRVPMEGTVSIPLRDGIIAGVVANAEQPEVVVRGRIRRHEGNWLVSLFLENANLQPPKTKWHVPSWIFQVQVTASAGGEAVFLPRPESGSGGDAEDRHEQQRLAMSYRLHPEFAVGSAAAVHATPAPDNPRRATAISTRTMPDYEIPATDAPNPETDTDLPELAELELGMAKLSELAGQGAQPVIDALSPLVRGYRGWIERNRAAIDDPDQHLSGFTETARENLDIAEQAADRIEAGIELLRDDQARHAFAFTNEAMHLQRVHTQVAERRRKDASLDLEETANRVIAENTSRWRPFQLAFVLLNLPALHEPTHPDRSGASNEAIADLLWFPTGGGKTEAYLGLTAFTLAMRRIQPGGGALETGEGVAVIMRYTLRLLTLQQFERATTLICATEHLRRRDPDTWGEQPFRIGLWVGGGVTPNTTDQVKDWIREIRKSQGRPYVRGSPHQLSKCPWCGSEIDRGRDIQFAKNAERTLVMCVNIDCPFGPMSGMNSAAPEDAQRAGLPVLVVDEEIYRYPPSLLIGTVDKFAQLAWRGEASALFGNVTKHCPHHGYLTEDLQRTVCGGESHKNPPAHVRACRPLRPPELVIQDELHLISGPLGSLVGLYENAVDHLMTWRDARTGQLVRPKVVASTATVRRANRQISSLFDRRTQVFPPAGISAHDNFFARQRDTAEKPGRRYVGICAHGTRTRSTLIRVYVSALGAAQKLHKKYGNNPITDPYMTLVGYFNSLRDLGGMRRLAEDDVSSRLKRARERGLENRKKPITKELTSRLSSDEIRPLLDQLEAGFPNDTEDGASQPLDVLLATNMIAVGVDVDRLGLMVVSNQPKSNAEYIQATSRVGRSAPGLVLTVYNWARPRDLSHYETFEHFHACAYRHVEPLSVTPFAERAIDRGLTGVLVSLIRGGGVDYNGNYRAQDFDHHGSSSEEAVEYLHRRAAEIASDETGQRVRSALEERLETWHKARSKAGSRLTYSRPRPAGDAVGLLSEPSEKPGRWDIMTCPTSLRDVEPAIQLQLQPADESDEDEPPFQDPSTSDEQEDER